MKQKVEKALEEIRPTLIAQGNNIELLSVTQLGIVRANLSGNCCSDRLRKSIALLAIERSLKEMVPGVVVVIDEQ